MQPYGQIFVCDQITGLMASHQNIYNFTNKENYLFKFNLGENARDDSISIYGYILSLYWVIGNTKSLAFLSL